MQLEQNHQQQALALLSKAVHLTGLYWPDLQRQHGRLQEENPSSLKAGMLHKQAAHLSGISTSLMCSVSKASSSSGIPALASVSQDLTEEPRPHSSAVRSADRAEL